MVYKKTLVIGPEDAAKIRKALTTVPTCKDDLILEDDERFLFTLTFPDGTAIDLSVMGPGRKSLRNLPPEDFFLNAPIVQAHLYAPGQDSIQDFETWNMVKKGCYSNGKARLLDRYLPGEDLFFRGWKFRRGDDEYILHVLESVPEYMVPSVQKGYEVEVVTKTRVYVEADASICSESDAIKKACERALMQTPDEQDATVLKVYYD